MADIEGLLQRFFGAVSSSLRSNGPSQTTGPTNWSPDVEDMQRRFSNIRFPFPRMTYNHCMDLHGSDKPDLRIPNTVSCPQTRLKTSF